ncbi:hypothetical protein QWY79_08305 [Halomonas sabkhae]|uniref:sulfotransferase-like domain-containing protein n=1 Tax=Halomonas sabkhae TaxID=626223 RepID=UPI0025B296DF|nr:hypothetical protein [Halomonas sabkhae]MDN3525272.1 hypothetical protein [Halomonas sabkhae]
MKIHFLWCVPRSLSTAFEKMVSHKKGFTVISEPFLDHYKNFEKTQGSRIGNVYEDFVGKIDDANNEENVLIKEMGFHGLPFFSKISQIDATHSFLVRSPAKSIKSLEEVSNGYKFVQAGFDSLYLLYCQMREHGMAPKIVMDADDLETSPILTCERFFSSIGCQFEASDLNWGVGAREEWFDRIEWHKRAARTSRFERGTRCDSGVFKSYKSQYAYEYSLPFYNYLMEARDGQKNLY